MFRLNNHMLIQDYMLPYEFYNDSVKQVIKMLNIKMIQWEYPYAIVYSKKGSGYFLLIDACNMDDFRQRAIDYGNMVKEQNKQLVQSRRINFQDPNWFYYLPPKPPYMPLKDYMAYIKQQGFITTSEEEYYIIDELYHRNLLR